MFAETTIFLSALRDIFVFLFYMYVFFIGLHLD